MSLKTGDLVEYFADCIVHKERCIVIFKYYDVYEISSSVSKRYFALREELRKL